MVPPTGKLSLLSLVFIQFRNQSLLLEPKVIMKAFLFAALAFVAVSFAAPAVVPAQVIEARDPQFKAVGPCGWTSAKRDYEGEAQIVC